MKKSFFFIFSITLFIIACSNKGNSLKTSLVDEAMAIADSVIDADDLLRYIAHYDSIGDERGELLIRQKYGTVKRNMSDFDMAVRQHDTCIQIATKQKDTLQQIIALNNQGTNFRRLGDLHEASNNHYAALELCDKTLSDTSYLARKNRVRTYNGLGNVMLSLGNDSVAEDLFRRALAGEKQLNSATGQAINLANIGAIKEDHGDVDSARVYYNLSMQKNIEDDNAIGISLCNQYLGHLEHMQGNTEMAMDYYRRAYDIGVKTGDVWHWLKPCETMAEIYIEEHKADSARKYINIALDAAIRIKARSHLARVYDLCAQLQEMTGQHRMAVINIRRSQAYKDSADIEQNQLHVQNLRVKYEVNKRKEQVELAETEAQYEKTLRKTVTWLSVFIILLIIVAVLSQIRALREKQRTNTLLKRIDRERQEFYRGITHQLRTPLTVVVGMTEQLQRKLPYNTVVQQEFDALKRKSNELLTLVTEMIEYNKGIRKDITVSELSVTDVNAATGHTDEGNAVQQGVLPEEVNDAESISDKYILVAEDDRDVALLITEMLRNEGYICAWASDGQEALDMIAKHMPQLLVTDIMMPRMDGIELIRNIRANDESRHLPIIVVSARTDDEDRLAGLDAGAEVYLGKPFLSKVLLLRVKRMLEQRDILRQKYSKEIAEADRLNAAEQQLNMSGSDIAFIKTIDEFIHDNIMNNELNANILADKMCISVTTLNRRIKATAGTNTTNYIRLKRLGRAKQLLSNTNMAMGEIQAVCGFDSPSYFSRAFKAEYGMSPSEFRKGRESNS